MGKANVLAGVMGLALVAAVAYFMFSDDTEKSQPAPVSALTEGPFPVTFYPERHAELSAAACRECHEDSFNDWADSHHAWANRPIDMAIDRSAFVPPQQVDEPGVIYTLDKADGNLLLSTTLADGQSKSYDLDGVIGIDPLIQYLSPFTGGRWQATTVAYDPKLKDWFDVFAGDGRLEGEWGHWTGQGMNWNANCAWCHMTDYDKNFDVATNTYHTTWLEQGVSCVQCHTGMEEHVAKAREPGYVNSVKTLSPQRVMDNCASCHSRRDELVGDSFHPGDLYHQHFGLSLPDQPGLYYPDGQIRDEVYVYASLMMSSMGHAGVTCMDCHDPHTNANILPIANNSLCQRCHESGLDDAPIIVPTEHSHHAAGSTGNLCVECHMPHTTYMQRDPRRDHGFLSPDPLLTRELGIPNACNTCHNEESVDWAVEWSEEWYGDKLADSIQRKRARALSAAYAYEPEASVALLALIEDDVNRPWRATYTGLLAAYLSRPGVIEYLESALKDESSLVRSRAVRSLGNIPQALGLIAGLLEDPSRNVRIEAERVFAVNGTPIPNEEAAAEWQAYLEFHGDRVDGAFLLAQEAIRDGEAEEAKRLIRQAVSYDERAGGVRVQAAVLFSQLGDSAAAQSELESALIYEPRNAYPHFSLGLLKWEQGAMDEAITYFENAVQLDPAFSRAWYNLGLAYSKVGRWMDARNALQGAARDMAQDPNWQQAYIAVERQLQRQQAAPQNAPPGGQ